MLEYAILHNHKGKARFQNNLILLLENTNLDLMDDIYAHYYLALTGRRFLFVRKPRATALCAFALG